MSDDDIKQTLREIEELVGRLKTAVVEPPSKKNAPVPVMCQENISSIPDWP